MKRLRITLEGKTYEVAVEVLDESVSSASSSGSATPFLARPAAAPAVATAAAAPVPDDGCTTVVCPMAGLVFKCLVKPGDAVTLNQVVIVLDAMKMETPVYAPVAGTVRSVLVKEGDAVDEGHSLLQIDGGA